MSILEIYNQGIEDRVATLEEDLKDLSYMESWFFNRSSRHRIWVADDRDQNRIVGWASLNRFSARKAHDGVAELSIYVRRDARGTGVGQALLQVLCQEAPNASFHKIVLFTFPFNQAGQRLYRKMGFREVGILQNHGKLDGSFVDIMVMEKLLSPATL